MVLYKKKRLTFARCRGRCVPRDAKARRRHANFLPSKLLPALATGTLLLAVCDFKSPLDKEVLDGGFGGVIAPRGCQDTEGGSPEMEQ